MMSYGIGIYEALTILFMAILSLAFPVAVVVLLVKIYEKLKNIEERLKDK